MKTDDQMQRDVLAELKDDPDLDASDIGVVVMGGFVTLAGRVDSYGEKCEAEVAAQRVAGVQALAIDVDVRLPGSAMRSDADITQCADNVLRWSTNLPKETVKARVKDGWITLSGDLDWEYQRLAVVKAVCTLSGVTGITDDLQMRTQVSCDAVKSDIEAALKRRATSDANEVTVDVRGSDVTLTGTVRSWSERELVCHSAWNTPGVRTVQDNMKAAY
jgi:osmotically-inducible protein OsmY